jgi:predicted TIM-barrel fold metal-dependent hydrolase
MTADLWPLDARAIDTHVHVDAVDYRPIEDFTSFWAPRRAVLSEHFASPSSDYTASLVAARPDLYRGLLLLRAETADDPGLEQVLAAPDRFGLRVRLRADSDLNAAMPAIDAVAQRRGFISLHCTWTIMRGSALPALLDRYPDLDVRIEHFGSWPYDEHRHFDRVGNDLFSRPSVYTMISSQYAFTAEPYPYPAAARVIREYLDAVGTTRTMWSTDWNRNDLDPARGDDYLHESADFLARVIDEGDAPQVLFRTAERFFRFESAEGMVP